MSETAPVVDPVVTDPVPDAAPVADPAPVAVAPVADPVSIDPAPSDEAKTFIDALPENWRDQVADKMSLDDSKKNVLSRYSSFNDFVESFFEKNEIISKGEHKRGVKPADGAAPEEIAAWRQEQGVPEAPADYVKALDEGVVLSDEDQTILDSVFEAAHASDIPAEEVGGLANAMFKARELEAQRVEAQHGIDTQNCVKQLRENWGGDFQTNMNMIHGLLNTLPGEVKDLFSQAQMPNGQMMMNNPEVLHWLASKSRELNPLGTVLPNDNNSMEAANSELGRIKNVMENDPDSYYKDEKMQERYRQLLTAQEKYQQLNG